MKAAAPYAGIGGTVVGIVIWSLVFGSIGMGIAFGLAMGAAFGGSFALADSDDNDGGSDDQNPESAVVEPGGDEQGPIDRT